MGALNDYYVDPSIAGNSGTGTSGDPYGDLQYALDQITRDATDGDRINVKAGTDEILSSALSYATYGTPSVSAPLVIQGYTSSQGDGGIGVIDCNSNQCSNQAYVSFIDMEVKGSGANAIFGNVAMLLKCVLHDSSGGLMNAVDATLIGNHIYDISAATLVACASFCYNYVDNTQTKKATTRIYDTSSAESRVVGNIFVMDSSGCDGVSLQDDSAHCVGNSILASGATGAGISIDVNRERLVVLNNLVEGFSGAGGVGFDGNSRSEGYHVFAGNAAYNNTTDYANDADSLFSEDNETLGASPFAKSGSNTFANRLTYFSPADTGNVRGGAFGQN